MTACSGSGGDVSLMGGIRPRFPICSRFGPGCRITYGPDFGFAEHVFVCGEVVKFQSNYDFIFHN